MDNAWGKSILLGILGTVVWKNMGEEDKQKVIRFLNDFGTSIAEAERKKREWDEAMVKELEKLRAEKTMWLKQGMKEPEALQIVGGPQIPRPSPMPKIGPDLASLLQLGPIVDTNARWREVIVPPSEVLILGKRGSGKSALGYRLLELFRYQLTPYVVGVPGSARNLLPDWIGIAPTLEELPPKTIALVDEAYLNSGSITCDIADEQVERIIGAIVLPDAWVDRVLAQVHLVDEVKRVQDERDLTQQRLKRLGQVYLDGLVQIEEYRRQRRILKDKLSTLIVPGVDAAMEAGKLLEDLPKLWQEADLGERRKILTAMLDAVYVDTKEEKAVVAIRPRPAFRPLFEIATTREGSNVALITTTPPDFFSPEASTSCSWWRRGRDDLPVRARLSHLRFSSD